MFERFFVQVGWHWLLSSSTRIGKGEARISIIQRRVGYSKGSLKVEN